MAKETSDELFIGSDYQRDFHIKNNAETVSIDITGWTLTYLIKRNVSDADNAALVTKATGAGITIAGTFNATPASNLQRASVSIADTDTDALAQGMCHYELKRMDAGFEAVLAYGNLDLMQGVVRA